MWILKVKKKADQKIVSFPMIKTTLPPEKDGLQPHPE